MECLRSPPPGPFHYLISEQAKSLVALQELQNEVGALLEFRDLVIETFPNLRSKMAPSTPAGGTRRDWEPGVRVRRKLANGTGDAARTKPQPSVQDSGFSTETSCGKDAHSSAASASRSRPLEDELWALLDVIQRKGVKLRDEAEILRSELDERHTNTAEESFTRALEGCGDCTDLVRLRNERDALLAHAAQLEAAAAVSPPPHTSTPLGRLDDALETPARTPRVAKVDPEKFTAILLESNPVELQRQLLYSLVQNQVISGQLKRVSAQRTSLHEQVERERDSNDDLKFRLEEKSVELEDAKARVRQLESKLRSSSLERISMRDMAPVAMPDERSHRDRGDRAPDTPRQSLAEPRARPSRIPLHTAHKGAAPRPPTRPASAQASGRSARSAVPVRRSPAPEKGGETALAAEYVARAARLAPLLARLAPCPPRPLRLPYEPPQNLALELTKSILYENVDCIDVKTLKSLNSNGDESLWNGKPQQYFESMNFGNEDIDVRVKDFEEDSLA